MKMAMPAPCRGVPHDPAVKLYQGAAGAATPALGRLCVPSPSLRKSARNKVPSSVFGRCRWSGTMGSFEVAPALA
jgi:hypothetical protein